MTHPQFRLKLEAINLAMVPIFLVALAVARGIPAVMYRGFVGGRRSAVAGLSMLRSREADDVLVAGSSVGA